MIGILKRTTGRWSVQIDTARDLLADAAHAADPDALEYVTWRGLAYERKGDDDHALADYNLVLQARPQAALARNFRGTLHFRKGALQSALDDFNGALKVAPNLYIAHVNRGRVLTINKDYDGALSDFAEAERIDPGALQARSSRCHCPREMSCLVDGKDFGSRHNLVCRIGYRAGNCSCTRRLSGGRERCPDKSKCQHGNPRLQ